MLIAVTSCILIVCNISVSQIRYYVLKYVLIVMILRLFFKCFA